MSRHPTHHRQYLPPLLLLLTTLLHPTPVHTSETLGPLAPISISTLSAIATARSCAAGCIVYQGQYMCRYYAGYRDLAVGIGCGCDANNGCFCSTGVASSASSYLSSCVSSRCSAAGNIDEDITSMIGIYDNYCKTANAEGISSSKPKPTNAQTTAAGSGGGGGGAGASAAQTVDSTLAAETAAGKLPAESAGPKEDDEGLSKSDIIALATGLGVGIPSLIVGVVALCLQMRKRRAAAAELRLDGTGASSIGTGSQTHMLQAWTPTPPPQPLGHGVQQQHQVYELRSQGGRRW